MTGFENLPYIVHFIWLGQSLICPATSKVYVNGMLSYPIPLGRGVSLGGPLSPLLFVLSTEPLNMTFMDGELLAEHLHRIKINDQCTFLLDCLSVDDWGLIILASKLKEVQNVIVCYKLFLEPASISTDLSLFLSILQILQVGFKSLAATSVL